MMPTPIKILVVDDEPPIRKLLRVGLAAQGYVVIEATNGKTAIEQMASSAPDLVILDLGLPDIQGHELAAALARGRRTLCLSSSCPAARTKAASSRRSSSAQTTT